MHLAATLDAASSARPTPVWWWFSRSSDNSGAMNQPPSDEKRRAHAVELMQAALAILDEVGPTRVAATLAMAIELAGSTAPRIAD